MMLIGTPAWQAADAGTMCATVNPDVIMVNYWYMIVCGTCGPGFQGGMCSFDAKKIPVRNGA